MEKEFSAKKLRSVFLVSFLLSTGLALTNYVDSSFLGTKIDVKNIGLIFSAGSITSIVLLSLAPRIIKNIGVRGLFYFAALLYLTSVLGMIYITTPIIFVLCFVFYVASAYGLYFAIDMFIERMSANKNAGVSRGTYLTIYNTAFLIGPLIAGTILKNYSYKLLYLIAGVFMITMFLLFIKNLEKTKFLPPRQSSFKAIFRALPKNKNLLNVYFVSLMLTFFFSWMGIFAPIYLKSVMGFDWQQIGTMFALMHIPYILLQLPFGYLADRYNCERSLMLIGLVIIALSTATLGFFTGPDFWIWTLALTATRTGASLVQVGVESYFFKKVDSQDSHLIAIFRYTSPAAYIIGPLVATVFLSFFAYNELFPILGIIMICVAFFSSRLKKIKTV